MAELNKGDALTILQITSNMLRFVGLSLILPIFVSIYYHETFYTIVFATMACLLIWIFSLIHLLLGKRTAHLKHAIISIALGWFVVGLVSVVPFLFAGISFVDAFFESISGWSTTGLSMIPMPESLPFSLNFWRGFTQWMGGFGIVILALIFFERPETAHRLFVAEGHTEDFFPNVFLIARTIVAIYIVYTAIGIGLLIAAGLGPFDAVIHSFASLSTGGFSTNSIGIGAFGKAAMAVSILLMLLGGISFESHVELFRIRIKGFYSNPEVKLLFGVIFFATALIFVNSFLFQNMNFFDNFFYVVSALTTTGASSTLPITSLPALSIFIIIILMIFGSCYGSTGGAIKLWRILLALSVVRREIRKAFLPAKVVVPLKIGHKIIPEDTALNALAYIALYLVFLAFGSIVLMFGGYGVIESVFTVASAQGNVGLSVISGEAWFGMNAAFKILLSIHMIVGRMEIIPFLVVLRGFGIVRKV